MINNEFGLRKPNLVTVTGGDDGGSDVVKHVSPSVPTPNTLRPRPKTRAEASLGGTAVDLLSKPKITEEFIKQLVLLIDLAPIEDQYKNKLKEMLPHLDEKSMSALVAVLDQGRSKPLLLLGVSDYLPHSFDRNRKIATGLVLPPGNLPIKFMLQEDGSLLFEPTIGNCVNVNDLLSPRDYSTDNSQAYIPEYIFPPLDSIWYHYTVKQSRVNRFTNSLEALFSIADGVLSCEDWVSKYPRLATGLEHRVSRLKNIMKTP